MENTPALQHTENVSAAVAKNPNRVTLDSIKSKIVNEAFFLGSDAVMFREFTDNEPQPDPHPDTECLTICLLTMRNGFTVIGKAAPADKENFDPELGRQFAYEDAIHQLWPLEGYLLREDLIRQGVEAKLVDGLYGDGELPSNYPGVPVDTDTDPVEG
jgi:hypothetical protein